ncbi:MAG: FxDxF family PEP-CTERM protein [Candidatus Parcubacteria bacterium]|nr:FxDxF family PEP-CTERM protein [Burkholderiales bacterium]
MFARLALKLKVAFVTGALLACTGVQAASFDWGLHGAGEAGVGFVSPGSFHDTWQFSIAGALVIDSSVAVSNNIPPPLSIVGGRYALFGFGIDNLMGNGDDVSFAPVLGWAFDGTTGSSQNVVTLAAGNYYFAVEGFADGTAGGLYTISSTISLSEPNSPVPEPDTYLVLLAGLGLLALYGRRRS